jgi:hypothetical protein
LPHRPSVKAGETFSYARSIALPGGAKGFYTETCRLKEFDGDVAVIEIADASELWTADGKEGWRKAALKSAGTFRLDLKRGAWLSGRRTLEVDSKPLRAESFHASK